MNSEKNEILPISTATWFLTVSYSQSDDDSEQENFENEPNSEQLTAGPSITFSNKNFETPIAESSSIKNTEGIQKDAQINSKTEICEAEFHSDVHTSPLPRALFKVQKMLLEYLLNETKPTKFGTKFKKNF